MHISIPDKEPQSGNAIERYLKYLLGLVRKDDREHLKLLSNTHWFAHKSTLNNQVLIRAGGGDRGMWVTVECPSPEDQDALLSLLAKSTTKVHTYPSYDATQPRLLAWFATEGESQ